MPNFNIFQDQGIFSIPALTAAVNRIPYRPRLIQALGLFEDKPTNTYTPIIERRIGERQIINVTSIGTRNDIYDMPNRTGDTLKAWSINTSDFLSKLDTVGIRRFGTMEGETVGTALADKMELMRQDRVESTIESLRMQTLLGTVTNQDGSTLVDWYNFFGDTPVTNNFVTATNANNVVGWCKKGIEAMQDALEGTPCMGYGCILGDAAWSALFATDEVKDLYKYKNRGDAGSALEWIVNLPGAPNPNVTALNGLAESFAYGGMTFMNYRASVGFPTSKAVMFPIGARDMFVSILCPSTLYQESEEFGLPFYALTWPKEDGSGLGIYVESNRIDVNMLPSACIQCTFS